jgi:hypothetical protein
VIEDVQQLLDEMYKRVEHPHLRLSAASSTRSTGATALYKNSDTCFLTVTPNPMP